MNYRRQTGCHFKNVVNKVSILVTGKSVSVKKLSSSNLFVPSRAKSTALKKKARMLLSHYP
jgi:hypothetical protein